MPLRPGDCDGEGTAEPDSGGGRSLRVVQGCLLNARCGALPQPAPVPDLSHGWLVDRLRATSILRSSRKLWPSGPAEAGPYDRLQGPPSCGPCEVRLKTAPA